MASRFKVGDKVLVRYVYEGDRKVMEITKVIHHSENQPYYYEGYDWMKQMNNNHLGTFLESDLIAATPPLPVTATLGKSKIVGTLDAEGVVLPTGSKKPVTLGKEWNYEVHPEPKYATGDKVMWFAKRVTVVDSPTYLKDTNQYIYRIEKSDGVKLSMLEKYLTPAPQIALPAGKYALVWANYKLYRRVDAGTWAETNGKLLGDLTMQARAGDASDYRVIFEGE